MQDIMQEILSLLYVQDVAEGAEKIKNLMKDISLGTTMHEAGIKDVSKAKDLVLTEFSPERMNNNPRFVKKEDIQSILDSIM